jgi:hypothetical protein
MSDHVTVERRAACLFKPLIQPLANWSKGIVTSSK